MIFSFSQATSSPTITYPAKVLKPQSVLAITRERSPSASPKRSIRSATRGPPKMVVRLRHELALVFDSHYAFVLSPERA